MTGIGGAPSPVSGFFQSEYIFPIQVPFKFGNGTNHPLKAFHFQPHFVKSMTNKRSIVTTLGIKVKKDLATDRSRFENQASANHAIAETITSKYIELFT